MVKYWYPSHFCFVIFIQGNQKASVIKKFQEDISANFFILKQTDQWNEEKWDERTLFDPGNPIDNNELGMWGKINLCSICSPLNKTMLSQLNNNQGIILFNHSQGSLLPLSIITNTVKEIFRSKLTKKILYLKLDEIRSTGKISQRKIDGIVENLKIEQEIPDELYYDINDKNKLETQRIYEIRRSEFY